MHKICRLTGVALETVFSKQKTHCVCAQMVWAAHLKKQGSFSEWLSKTVKLCADHISAAARKM